MNLGEFLTNQSLGSWADEMDSQPLPAMSTYSSAGNRDRDQGERRGFSQANWGEARGSGSGSAMEGRGTSYGENERTSPAQHKGAGTDI